MYIEAKLFVRDVLWMTLQVSWEKWPKDSQCSYLPNARMRNEDE